MRLSFSRWLTIVANGCLTEFLLSAYQGMRRIPHRCTMRWIRGTGVRRYPRKRSDCCSRWRDRRMVVPPLGLWPWKLLLQLLFLLVRGRGVVFRVVFAVFSLLKSFWRSKFWYFWMDWMMGSFCLVPRAQPAAVAANRQQQQPQVVRTIPVQIESKNGGWC